MLAFEPGKIGVDGSQTLRRGEPVSIWTSFFLLLSYLRYSSASHHLV